MAAACRVWRALASTPCLWTSLDLRAHRCSAKVAASLASRCGGLRRLHLRGHEAAAAAPLLRASGLREVMLDKCSALTDITLAVLAARHAALESIQVGLERIELVSSVALRHVAHCCPHLRRLRLGGLRDASADAVGALASYCPQLEEVAFADCRALDAAALGGIRSLRFISVSGCANLNWAAASASWAQLPSLLAVDVSRTDVPAIVVSHLLSRCETLKLVWTFGCKFVSMELAENPTTFSNHSGKLVPISSTDIFESVISMFSGKVVKEQGDYNLRNKDKLLDDTMTWLEWILSYSGISSLLTLLQSSQEDVQIRAVVTLSMFNHFCENLWEAIVQHGMIPMLLDFAKSSKESTQLEAAKAISSLFSDEAAVDTVADQGGIAILVNLAKSMNRLVAKEAANGLRLLSTNEDQLDAIVAADGIKPLVDLIFRSPADSDEVLADAIAVLQNLGPRLEVVKAGGIHASVDLIARLACLCRPLSYEVLYGAVDTLATLADDDECSMEVTKAGGVHALDKLAQLCEDRVHRDIQNKAATALAYLAAHEYKNKGNAAVGQEAGAIDAFIQLLSSQNERVRESAVDALSCLSGDRYREALAWFSLAHENV